MRCLLPIALLAVCALPASAEYTAYSDLRQENPIINEVIGELSSSDLHGTLNRISALFTRGQVRDLADGTLDSALADNVVRNLQNALADLGQDIAAADEDLVASGLTGDELLRRQWVLIQVVNQVFSARMLELSYLVDDNISCGTSSPSVSCPYDATYATPTLEAFNDELLRDPDNAFAVLPLANWLAAVRDSAFYEDDFNNFGNGGLDPRDFVTRVEQLQTTSPVIEGNFLVHGEPSIDS